MSWIPHSWRNDKNKPKVSKPKNRRFAVKHRIADSLKSDKVRWTQYCPNLCQQKTNGGKGKKTFDGKICNSCGYKKSQKNVKP